MKRTAAGQMRLQREARMAKKEIETQIKKSGKITDNFICLPDPENAYIWYYVVFGLDIDGFRGGYYFGKIICPDEYPSKPPKIILITPNGRFHTWDNGICLSISDYHPESWNAAWKVNQIVIGLLSFWMQNEEYTYGAVSDHEKRELDPECDELNLTFTQVRTKLAMKSTQKVREHEMFKKIFEEFADVLGINTETEKPNEWIELEKVLETHRKKKEEEAE